MTTDNRTDEPTDNQILDYAKEDAERVFPKRWYEVSNGAYTSGYFKGYKAALAAAAGAAPQAGTSAPSKYINPSLPGMVRNLWKSDPSEASVRTALGLAGDLIQELIDLRAAPVQVDREAMQ